MKRITACLLVLCLLFGLTPSVRASATAESKRDYIIVLGTDVLKESTGLKLFMDYKSINFDVSVISMADIAKQFTTVAEAVERLRQYLDTKTQPISPYVLLVGTMEELPMVRFYSDLNQPSYDAMTDACLLYDQPLSFFDGNGNGKPGEYVEYPTTKLVQKFVIGRLPTDSTAVLDTYFPLLIKAEKGYDSNPSLSGMVACAVESLISYRYNADIEGELVKKALSSVSWTTLYEKEGAYISTVPASPLNATNFSSNWNQGLDIVFTSAHDGRMRLVFNDKNNDGNCGSDEEQWFCFWGRLADLTDLTSTTFFGYLNGCHTFIDGTWSKVYYPYLENLLEGKLLNFVGYASVISVIQDNSSLGNVFTSIGSGCSIGDAVATAQSIAKKNLSWWSIAIAGDPSARMNNKTSTIVPISSFTSARPGSPIGLSWNKTDPVWTYHVQVSNSPNFTNLVKLDIAYTNSYQITSLPIGNYYWRVQGVYDNGAGNWSETKSFEVYEPLSLAVNFLPTQVSDPEAVVSGSTTGSRVLVNGQEQIVTSGKFSTVITLSLGRNTIKVVALDDHGHSTTKELVITYQTLKTEMVLELTIGVPTIWIDGKALPLDAAPSITNSRTLVPLRAIFEAVGGDVGWDPSTRQIAIVSRGQKLILTIGKNTASLNGKIVSIDSDPRVVPTITNGRTLLPLRFVAEAFSFQVDWNATARSIVLTYGGGS